MGVGQGLLGKHVGENKKAVVRLVDVEVGSY